MILDWNLQFQTLKEQSNVLERATGSFKLVATASTVVKISNVLVAVSPDPYSRPLLKISYAKDFL